MQKTIYKYPLVVYDMQIIEIINDAEILSIQVQNGVPCLWALVDPKKEKEERTFEIFGTGNPMMCDDDIRRKFIGTFQMYDGKFHL